MAELMTVLGPVDVQHLGITLPHEHLLIDLSCLWHQPIDPAREILVDAPVVMENRGLLVCDPYHSRDNLRIDDVNLASTELARFKSLGGGTVIDLSTRSLGPYPEQLAEISRRTGLHIIAGTGFYTRAAHPDYVKEASISALAQQMINDLTEGFSGTNIRAGVIGEIGSSSPIHADEIKVLHAAAIAQKETGAGINVHLPIFAREGHNVLDLLCADGVEPSCITLSHLDENPDLDYHLSLAKRGCFVEFDCFGSEVYFDEDNLREPSDAERIDALLSLLDAGFENQILLSQDICTKMQLRKYGGMGYDHILLNIVPRLRKRGVDQSLIDRLLIENPARFLCRGQN